MNTGQCMQIRPIPHTRARMMEVPPRALSPWHHVPVYYTEARKWFLCKTNIDVNFD